MEVSGGTTIGPNIEARNDHGNHWLLEPSKEMSIEEYKASLTALNSNATRIEKPEKPPEHRTPGSLRQSVQGYPIRV